MSTSKLYAVLFLSVAVASGCAANPSDTDAGPPPSGDAGVSTGDGGTEDLDGSVPPRDGSTCTGMDACTLGAQRCSGTQVQECEIDPTTGCTDWAAPGDCPMDLFCSADMCTDTCVDACTDGARRCASDGSFQVCAMQTTGCLDWDPVMDCPVDETCTGEGVCMACTDGATRCGPTGAVEECFSGRWTQIEGCPFGCSAGTCTTMVTCTPGAYRCLGDRVETCNSSGTAWLHVRTCSVACGGGLCTGACTPGERRCNGMAAEVCNTGGTAWDVAETCTTYCSRGGCALSALDVASNMTLDGDIVVDGPFIVRSGATLTASTGELTIHADSIMIENGASISVAPAGDSEEGRGGDGIYTGCCSYYRTGGGGGGYGTRGDSPYGSSLRGPEWGSDLDAVVMAGSRGGDGYGTTSQMPGTGGMGGGALRLIATGNVMIAGSLTANGQNGSAGESGTGGGGGGSGGGILIAGDMVTVTGNVSAIGGGGAMVSGTARNGGNGGDGRVKILYGSGVDSSMASLSGQVTEGLLPPIEIGSSTHPNPNLIYNDGFPVVGMTWERPFDPIQGYYWRHYNSVRVPTPADSEFIPSEIVSFDTADLREGTNYFLVASVTPTAEVGTVTGAFRIQLNRTPPTVDSTSHTSSTSWSMNSNPFFSWTLPHDDENYQGVYYIFDHYGDTVPTRADSFLPIDQKQVLLSAVADGIWVLHVVSVDTQGYLTQEAGHYQVRIGADPGSGTVFGQVTDASTSMPISSATVQVNRGVFPDQTTNSTGNFNFADVADGMWELRVRADGFQEATQTITVMDGMSTAANVALMPDPTP